VVLNETSAGRQVSLSYPDYEYLRDHDRAFTGLIGSRNVTVNLGSGLGALPVIGELVTGNYFQQLGVRAQLGRTLLPSDDVAPGQHPVVVLSDSLWKRAFAADRDIVGTVIRLNTYPLTVVGVAEPAFHGTIVSFDVEVFLPIMMAPQIGPAGLLQSVRRGPRLGAVHAASGPGAGRRRRRVGDAGSQYPADVCRQQCPTGGHREPCVRRGCRGIGRRANMQTPIAGRNCEIKYSSICG
jgi:hypothetical protein